MSGEAGRFIVDSASRPGESHMVDMSMNNGNGSCSCTDFSVRRYPLFNKHKRTILFGQSKTVCKHILEVMKYELKQSKK